MKSLMTQPTNPFDLSGHTALITGGTQGVGRAIATAVAAAGANVVITGLQIDEQAESTLAVCRSFGVQADAIQVDMARSPELYLDQLVDQVIEVAPDVDLLVNNAGTYIDTPFLEMDFERFQKTMHLNVTAGYFITQAFARRWIENNQHGRVVFTGSINGFLAEPDHTAYDTSKGAVTAMVKSLCVSLAPHHIRVNAMAPGLVRTPLTDILNQDQRLDGWMKLHTPNGDVPGPEVCSGAVVFLLSDAASHVHGQTILVDGGMSIWQQPDPPETWDG